MCSACIYYVLRTQRIRRFYHARLSRPAPAVYIQCTSKKPASNPLCAPIVRDAQRCTNYLQKLGNVFRQFVIRAGYHAASSFRQTSKVPAIKTRRKSLLGTQSARVSRLLCGLTVSCPLVVAHAPHKVAGVQRAGIFLSLQGNDMAKCQRTKLDTARSLYSAFCSAGMLYSEQCMTCLRLQARSKPAVISISRGEI